MCKVGGAGDGDSLRGGSGGGGGGGSSGSERLSLEDEAGWERLRTACVDKITPAQLRAWLEFVLGGGKQPLSSAAAGKLTQPHVPPRVALAMCRDALKLLPEVVSAAAAAAAVSAPGGGISGGSGGGEGTSVLASAAAGGKPMSAGTRALLQLFARLCVLSGLEASQGLLPGAVRGFM